MLLLLAVMMVGMLKMLKLLAECWDSMLHYQLQGLIQLSDQVSFDFFGYYHSPLFSVH